MRVWIDLTNSPHVLVLRPVIDVLRADGHEVCVTARDFAQTLALCERFGISHTAIGRHRGGRVAAKSLGLAQRSGALVRWARRHGPFDLAIGHGSNDVMVAAAALRIPATTTFDYEFATVQHTVNCRLASAVVVPEAIPPERLDRYGARHKLRQYPGLKEEYYLAGFEPDRTVPARLGVEPDAILCVVRTAPAYALYLGSENALEPRLLRRLSGVPEAQTVVLTRTPEQADAIEALDLPRVVVPRRAVDGRSLVALADLLVSAGGTMNREAAVLCTPVWSTFEGRLGAIDEMLIRDGRLSLLTDPAEVVVARKARPVRVIRGRDPRDLLNLALPWLPRGASPAGPTAAPR